ncbi:hypothetical protein YASMINEVIRUS_416 [Yasminevirus sp. GU-2018]|uniref:Uncharacterized protein n=1 Tax=Yasminevirus sp. GU-2018 TaxID=2420051 RepID=A0A5K0U9A8_9VIRU|nr:hypothetical protein YASMINEVIRUS_416 [Yasminevirus sp. GU-2018]
MDTFFAIPTSTTYTPLSSASSVIVEDIVTPILPVPTRTVFTNIPRVNVVTGLGVTSVYRPSGLFYYDSGIGENPVAQNETNMDLRYKFLDKWLYENYPEILKKLKVDGNNVRVASKNEEASNDISKDSESDLEKKSDFVGSTILTLGKNKKILDTLCTKNNLKYYDLPHNEHFVRKAQGRYVLKHLEEMQGK